MARYDSININEYLTVRWQPELMTPYEIQIESEVVVLTPAEAKQLAMFLIKHLLDFEEL